MEQAVYLGNGGEEATLALAALSSRRVNARGYGTGVAARLAGAAGQQLAPRGRRRAGWRGDRRRARGGGVGVGGEELAKNARKKMALAYICHTPLLPVPAPTRSKGPLLPVRVTNRE